MDKLDLNELLRYFVIGLFFMLLNYLVINPNCVAEQLALFGKEGIVLLFSGISLVSGAIIYVLYRAFFYPILVNPLTTWVTHSRRKIKFVLFRTRKHWPWEIILIMDKKRWKVTGDMFTKNLPEWASQVHFLYNLAFSCLGVWLLNRYVPSIYVGYGSQKLLLTFGLLLAIALLHHIRYKHFETEVLYELELIERGSNILV